VDSGSSVLERPILPIPRGWYALGLDSDVPPGAVRGVTFCGEERVLFRGRGGTLGWVSALCPHLGAHLGRGGTVVGEHLQCPFHGFQFDAEGVCRKTGYGTRPPPTARLSTSPVQVHHGVILAWFDPEGGPPAFEVPPLDMEGWTPFRLHAWTLRGHPQETTENSVDVGHFAWVHGYRDVEEVEAARADGPLLTARYRFRKPLVGSLYLQEEIHVLAAGLGYSRVEVLDRLSGQRLRLLVLPQPETADRVRLRIGLSVGIPSAARARRPTERLVGGLLHRVVAPAVLQAYRREVEQDFQIWNHKAWVARPALAAGDGPIGLYRRWSRQFYPVPPEQVVGAAALVRRRARA
jgi:nitrite reductase/ring-hydroxylating ferredoxin subunit